MDGRSLRPGDVDEDQVGRDGVGEDQVGRDGSSTSSDSLLVSTIPTTISPVSHSSLDSSSPKTVDNVAVSDRAGLNAIPDDTDDLDKPDVVVEVPKKSSDDHLQELPEYEDAPFSASPEASALGGLDWLASYGISYSDHQPDISAEGDDDSAVVCHGHPDYELYFSSSGDPDEDVGFSGDGGSGEAVGNLDEGVGFSGDGVVDEDIVDSDSSPGSGDHSEVNVSGDGPLPASGTFLRVDAIISGVHQPINRASIIINNSEGDVLPDPLDRVQRGVAPPVGNTFYSLIC